MPELVATGSDPLGSVLRHEARIVPWPATAYDLQVSYIQKSARRVIRKLGGPDDWLDPSSQKMDRVFDKLYRESDKLRSVLKEIESADFVFDMGHGALNDVFDPFMLCFLYYLAGRLERPLFISGQSIGPLWRTR